MLLGSNKLAPKPYNFKGLGDISRTKSNNLSTDISTAIPQVTMKAIGTEKRQLLAKGFETAFIVAYKNGQKISIQAALKSTKQ